VHGIDLWTEGVNQLLRTARERGLKNVTAESADLARLQSVRDAEVDLALMATVLHDQVERGVASAALREVARVVRPDGWLAVVEFKKADTKPGPPVAIRLSAEDLTALVGPFGFAEPRVVDLGPGLYLALFQHVAKGSHA
jgi:ubiquinone/menaquinone biosynthesis C-methylase UbiE